ncbi:MAG: malonate decarboxylase acyl carrier protein [Leptothrix sp. (in: b-proteobacteria)]
MNNAVGIETMQFEFEGQPPPPASAFPLGLSALLPVLVGVVGSGNLEVLIEPAAGTRCSVEVETSARGFRPIWQAVLSDFHARHALAGVRVSINDMGATPAVVSLRLDQAVAEWRARP